MKEDTTQSVPGSEEILPNRDIRMRNGEIDSLELFKKVREVRIRHGDQMYRLRLTSLNKLILTK